MVDTELLKYVKSVKNKGHSDKDIKEHLIKHGHSKDHVEELFKHPDLKKKHAAKKLKLSPFLIIFLIIIVLGSATFLLNSSSSDCEDVSITLHEINNEQVLCVFPDNSKIQTILKNNGVKVINSVNFIAKGSEGKVSHDLVNLNFPGGDISTHSLNYGSDNGQLKKITITPSVLINDKVKVCKTKKVSYENIKTC